MNQRERERNEEAPAPAAPAAGAGGTGLNTIRQTVADMLAAADDAVSKVLSGDSEAFNTAVRQEGGQ